MSEDRKIWCEYTAYPKKYKNSYWGNFGSIPEAHIVENRNRFITDYDIKNFVKHTKKYCYKADKVIKTFERNKWFDHYELYSLNNSENLLAVISPYNGAIREMRDEIINSGWTEIYPIYTDDATTFIFKIFLK